MTAARHLIELGHQRIAAIGGPDELWSCRARLDGYRSALRRAGLPVDDTLVRCDDLSADGGLRQARALLSVPDAPTAIVAGNDAQAFGVLQALAERGRRCPDDLSVTGFNDLPIATWATPPLTTIRQPLAAMAATAFWMLTSIWRRSATPPPRTRNDAGHPPEHRPAPLITSAAPGRSVATRHQVRVGPRNTVALLNLRLCLAA